MQTIHKLSDFKYGHFNQDVYFNDHLVVLRKHNINKELSCTVIRLNIVVVECLSFRKIWQWDFFGRYLTTSNEFNKFEQLNTDSGLFIISKLERESHRCKNSFSVNRM